MPINLTIQILKNEASLFAKEESSHYEPTLFGVTDGKAVGTYLEHKFQQFLIQKYTYVYGSSAKGIDFPELGVDLKTTSIKQPQSSCPFRSASQNADDVLAFFSDRMLPLDDIQAVELAEKVLAQPPEIGYLTISNALQWRLQYSRVIQQAGTTLGIDKL